MLALIYCIMAVALVAHPIISIKNMAWEVTRLDVLYHFRYALLLAAAYCYFSGSFMPVLITVVIVMMACMMVVKRPL